MTDIDLEISSDVNYEAFLIFGPPGAGKGTISALLTQLAPIFHLSTGDIFRGISPESTIGKLIHSYSSKGHYVPDQVTVKIWQHYVRGLIATNRFDPWSQSLLLDGIPRTVEQAKALDEHISVRKIIFLDVEDEEVLVQRLLGRAQKEGRADDGDVEVIRTRMRVYKEKTEKILQHYDQELIVRVNADQALPAVLHDVLGSVLDVLAI
jgi:adenylate kinase